MRQPVLEIVHPNFMAGTMLAHALSQSGCTVRRACAGWTEFARRWSGGLDAVVLGISAKDHIPHLVKVRSLRCWGVEPITVYPESETGIRDLMRFLGAVTVCEEAGLAAAAAAISAAAHGAATTEATTAGVTTEAAAPGQGRDGAGEVRRRLFEIVAGMSDRQLQVSYLTSGIRRLTVAETAQVLGLSAETVRHHLGAARRTLADGGRSPGVRREFARMLREAGVIGMEGASPGNPEDSGASSDGSVTRSG